MTTVSWDTCQCSCVILGSWQAECQSGYSPSVKELSCSASVLTPATFTCNPNACKLPRVQYQAGDEERVAWGSCAECVWKWVTECHRHIKFRWDALRHSQNSQAGNGCQGKRGNTIPSGSTCQTQCADGLGLDRFKTFQRSTNENS